MLERSSARLAQLDKTRGVRWLNRIDIFGFQPSPRYKGSERSVVGSIFSLAVIVLIIFYVVSTLIRFFNFNPLITTALYSVQASDNIKVGPGSPLDFAVVFRPAPLNETFWDDRYFTLTMRVVKVTEEDLLPRAYTDVLVSPCNFTSRWLSNGVDTGFIGQTAFCPQQSSTLFGSYSQKEFTFLEIDVTLCNNTTRPDCVSEDQVWDKLRGGRLNFMFVQQDFTPSSTEKSYHYLTTFYLFKRDTLQLSELFFRKKTVSIQPDYLRQPFTIDDETVLFEREKTYTSDPLNDNRILILFLRFDTILNVQVWSVQTLFDLLGSWSAFFGILSVSLGAIALTYNTHTFYKRSPAWDNFDERFQSEGGVGGSGRTEVGLGAQNLN